MIAITRQVHQDARAKENDRFLAMLPRIRYQARLAFRCIPAEQKDELVQEVIAHAYVAYMGLVHRGKADVAFATPLADYAIRSVLASRQFDGTSNMNDVLSRQARAANGFVVERLDTFDEERCEWRAALVEDRRAGPAEIAAARLDVAAWLRSLSPRSRRIAKILATGELPSIVAKQFKLSRSRVSQLRGELEASWRDFQGEEPLPALTSQALRCGRVALVA